MTKHQPFAISQPPIHRPAEESQVMQPHIRLTQHALAIHQIRHRQYEPLMDRPYFTFTGSVFFE